MLSTSHANQKRRKQFMYLALFSLLLHLLLALIIFQHAFKRHARSFIQALQAALTPAEQAQLAAQHAARKEIFEAVFAELKTKEDPIIAALNARNSQTVWMDVDTTALENVTLDDVAQPIDQDPGFTSAHEQAGEMIAASEAAATAELGESATNNEPQQDTQNAAAAGTIKQNLTDAYSLDQNLPDVTLPGQIPEAAYAPPAASTTQQPHQAAAQPHDAEQKKISSDAQQATTTKSPTPSKFGLGKGRTLLAMTNQFLKGFGRAGGTGTDFTDRAGSTSVKATTADLEATLYREKINACWVAAFNQAESYKALRRKLWEEKITYRNAVINYTIDKNGKLITANLEQSTGNQNLDTMIMHAIKAVARFPAAPKHFTQETYTYTELIKAEHLDGSESFLVLRKG